MTALNAITVLAFVGLMVCGILLVVWWLCERPKDNDQNGGW